MGVPLQLFRSLFMSAFMQNNNKIQRKKTKIYNKSYPGSHIAGALVYLLYNEFPREGSKLQQNFLYETEFTETCIKACDVRGSCDLPM